MTTGVDVRTAGVEDAEAIAEVHVASWHRAYEGLLPASLLEAQTVERRTILWRAELAKSGQSTWVALGAEAVVGFASAGPARDPDVGPRAGELYAIYVAPPAWDKAVGHALHQAAVAQLATEYSEVVLWVLDGNSRARRFYERHGWLPEWSGQTGTARCSRPERSALPATARGPARTSPALTNVIV